jgi:aspartyl protease family protein
MLWLAALGLLGGLTAFFSLFMGQQGGTMSSSVDSAGQTMVVIEQGRGSHYLAAGTINGQAVDFLVDTGATDVAISNEVARRLGLEFGPQITVMTAAGPAPAWLTRLESVSIGGLRRENVRASITPGLGEQALLGMSFLRHFSIRQEGGNLIIASAGSPGS